MGKLYGKEERADKKADFGYRVHFSVGGSADLIRDGLW